MESSRVDEFLCRLGGVEGVFCLTIHGFQFVSNRGRVIAPWIDVVDVTAETARSSGKSPSIFFKITKTANLKDGMNVGVGSGKTRKYWFSDFRDLDFVLQRINDRMQKAPPTGSVNLTDAHAHRHGDAATETTQEREQEHGSETSSETSKKILVPTKWRWLPSMVAATVGSLFVMWLIRCLMAGYAAETIVQSVRLKVSSVSLTFLLPPPSLSEMRLSNLKLQLVGYSTVALCLACYLVWKVRRSKTEVVEEASPTTAHAAVASKDSD